MRRRPVVSFIIFVVLVLVGGSGEAGESDLADYIRSHYTKFEYRIPMRDGVELFTVAYVPNDASDERTYPIILARSPYSVGPYGVDRYPESFYLPEELVRDGFIIVEQDVRGRFMSGGEFVNMRPHVDSKHGPDDIDESTDAWDTVEWLVTHLEYAEPRVGIWGNSYLGFYTSAGIIDTHPAIKAAMPSAPIADWVVKLIDEFPGRLEGYDPKSGEKDLGGTRRLIRSEIFRGRYRNGYDRPEAFVPGQPTRVVVPLQAILHTFKKGHRIVIEIQSTLFPFFDRNPQTFIPNIYTARDEDFVKATHRVYVSGEHPSVIRVGILPGPAGVSPHLPPVFEAKGERHNEIR